MRARLGSTLSHVKWQRWTALFFCIVRLQCDTFARHLWCNRQTSCCKCFQRWGLLGCRLQFVMKTSASLLSLLFVLIQNSEQARARRLSELVLPRSSDLCSISYVMYTSDAHIKMCTYVSCDKSSFLGTEVFSDADLRSCVVVRLSAPLSQLHARLWRNSPNLTSSHLAWSLVILFSHMLRLTQRTKLRAKKTDLL